MPVVRTLLGCLMSVAGAALATIFYDRYWLWRDCFNELGRCFDPASQDVYLEQAGPVYGGLAVIFPLAGASLLLWRPRPRRGGIY